MANVWSASEGCVSRSRKGAWIEIDKLNEIWGNGHVAPVRERGLK